MSPDFTRPDWVPQLPRGKRVLVAGATGGLGAAIVSMLLEGSDCVVGAHGSSRIFEAEDDRIIPLQAEFVDEESCSAMVEGFCERAGGIDALVVL